MLVAASAGAHEGGRVVITEPYNDRECLGKVTAQARERANSPSVHLIARRHATTEELAAWIQTLPQDNDTGDPLDGPKVECDVPQRLRIPARRPNCLERAAIFMAAAENIDPTAVYALATIDTDQGRHTYPTKNGQPVVLDPVLPRNALAAGLDAIGAAAIGGPVALTLSQALGWALSIAEEPAAAYADAGEVLADAHATASAILEAGPIDRRGLAALLWVLALAEREQARWWPGRAGAIRHVVELLAERAPWLVADSPSCGCGPGACVKCARNGWRIEWAPRRFFRAVEDLIEPAQHAVRPLVKPAIKLVLTSYGVPPELVEVADRGIDAARGNRARPAVDTAARMTANTANTSEDA